MRHLFPLLRPTPGLALALLLLPGAAPLRGQSLNAAQARAISALERELAADAVRDSVGSLAAAVFVDGEVAWEGAFGWQDRERRTLATPATVYRVGSVSKTITALVLLRLVASGAVDLDEPVAEHLPEIRRLPGGDPMATSLTFRQLATHTGGLAREPDRVNRFGRGPFRDWKRTAVAAIPATRVLHPPGERYHYSNIGYALLGFALERAAGVPFELLADSLVFRPLGMRSTSLLPPAQRLATGYVNLPGDTADPRVPRAEHRGRGYRVPNGGVYSTVGDLARLGMALTGAAPLLPDSLRGLMLRNARPAPEAGGGDARPGYGLGVQLIDLGTVTLAGHSGRVPGYSAQLLVDPERGTGIALLRNYTHGASNLGALATRLLLDLGQR